MMPVRDRICLRVQAELHREKQRGAKLQDSLDTARALLDTDKAELVEQSHNLQNLLLHLKAGGLGKDRAEQEIEEAHLLDGFMPGVRDSVGEDMLTRGLEAQCLQQTLETEAREVRRAPAL